jgi:hypothetical protein
MQDAVIVDAVRMPVDREAGGTANATIIERLDA